MAAVNPSDWATVTGRIRSFIPQWEEADADAERIKQAEEARLFTDVELRLIDDASHMSWHRDPGQPNSFPYIVVPTETAFTVEHLHWNRLDQLNVRLGRSDFRYQAGKLEYLGSLKVEPK